jgi:hypothetical protein
MAYISCVKFTEKQGECVDEVVNYTMHCCCADLNKYIAVTF